VTFVGAIFEGGDGGGLGSCFNGGHEGRCEECPIQYGIRCCFLDGGLPEVLAASTRQLFIKRLSYSQPAGSQGGMDMRLFGPPKGKETLVRYLWKYRFQFIISSIGGILYNTVIVFSPILLGRLIDAAGSGAGQKVLLSAALFVGVTTFFQMARWVKRWFMRDQFNRVACDLRQTFLERMLSRNATVLEKETVGDLMSRTVGDITLVVDTVMTTLNEGWDTWLLMISFFVAMLFQDWQVTLMASLMVPVTIVLAQSMRHVLYRFSMAARKASAESNSSLQRYLSAVAVLRLFGREEKEAEEIHGTFARQAEFTIKELLIQQALLPVYALLAGLGIVVVLALGGQRVVEGQWTIGSFNAYLIMFIAFSGRTRVAARVFNRWHAARAAWVRVKEKMLTTPEAGSEECQGSCTDSRTDSCINSCTDSRTDSCTEFLAGSSRSTFPDEALHADTLEIRGLRFGFGAQDFLGPITLSARKGQIIGITGPVGSGKSLLAQALTGLYPYKGSIRVDGRELSGLAAEKRSRLIAYAGHEQLLFSMTIRENVTLTDPVGQAPDVPLLKQALAAAALQEELPRFEQGLETRVGEKGVLVSGGQRQRIALARALYAPAPILILDDPFSAVDIATEETIINHLRKDYPDRLILLLSHRLNAFQHADQVLVLRQGGVIQSGPHDVLRLEPGLYRDILQAQRFLEEHADETL